MKKGKLLKGIQLTINNYRNERTRGKNIQVVAD